MYGDMNGGIGGRGWGVRVGRGMEGGRGRESRQERGGMVVGEGGQPEASYILC